MQSTSFIRKRCFHEILVKRVWELISVNFTLSNDAFYVFTVRKIMNLPASLILREINFSHFKSYKVPFLLIWRLWMLFFGEFQISKNARNQQNQNLVSVNAEFAVFDILEFHKLFSRKIWGAEKCSNLRIVRGRV